TCNRVEFMYVSRSDEPPSLLLHRLLDFFFVDKPPLSFFPNDFYHYVDRDATTHLFRTVSSLESVVIGETQITGQFKQAYQDASRIELTGPTVDGLADEALKVARTVRRNTTLGVGSVSMASLAANAITSGLTGATDPVIALVGSGEMTAKLARYFRKERAGRLLFVNRTLSSATELANRYDGQAMSLNQFQVDPPRVSAIVSATSATEPLFDYSFVQRLPKASCPVLCIDLAVPRDFGDDVCESEAVRLIGIPELKAKGHGNTRRKFIESEKANRIVQDAVERYMSARVEMSLKPIFHDSYRESIALAQHALNDLFARRVTTLDESQQEAIEQMVTKLIGHSSFGPVRCLSSRLAELHSEINIDRNHPGSKTAV
ncbi:MAG: hypothetical protein ACE5FH_10450, partial [Candidatus Zixiibacteriota bacterium]